MIRDIKFNDLNLKGDNFTIKLRRDEAALFVINKAYQAVAQHDPNVNPLVHAKAGPRKEILHAARKYPRSRYVRIIVPKKPASFLGRRKRHKKAQPFPLGGKGDASGIVVEYA